MIIMEAEKIKSLAQRANVSHAWPKGWKELVFNCKKVQVDYVLYLQCGDNSCVKINDDV
jgi:hypothetical protein